MKVSIGQASRSALADWLRSQLLSDITVFDRWPEPGTVLPPKAVSVILRGRRSGPDVCGLAVGPVVPQGPNSVAVVFEAGNFVQPMQLDVWAKSDVERDDIIAQLDVALNAGEGKVFGFGDPVRDGLLLAFRPVDGFDGYVDYWFDDVAIDDMPDTVQRGEFRATYLGEARGALERSAVAPKMRPTQSITTT